MLLGGAGLERNASRASGFSRRSATTAVVEGTGFGSTELQAHPKRRRSNRECGTRSGSDRRVHRRPFVLAFDSRSQNRSEGCSRSRFIRAPPFGRARIQPHPFGAGFPWPSEPRTFLGTGPTLHPERNFPEALFGWRSPSAQIGFRRRFGLAGRKEDLKTRVLVYWFSNEVAAGYSPLPVRASRHREPSHRTEPLQTPRRLAISRWLRPCS